MSTASGQPKLSGVTCRAVVAPLPEPLVTKILVIREAPLLLVDLHTDEGITGSCYLFAFTRAGCRHLAGMIEDLVARNVGRPVAPSTLFDANTKALSLFGHQGVAAMAVAAVDMCAWDIAAKAAGLPLYGLLGGEAVALPTYNSNGLGLSDPASLGDEALRLMEAGGFNAVKIRLGRDDPRDDVKAVRAVRDAIGADALLPCDFNQGLTVAEAISRGRMLDDEGLYWIEEPVAYDDMQGQARIAAVVETPIQIGENFYGPAMTAEAIAASAGDFFMFDVMRIGGVTGWLRASALSASASIPVSSHLFPEISSHLMTVTPTAHWLEYMSWGDAVLAEPLSVHDGTVAPSAAPGSGVAWDEDAVRRYQL